MSIGRKIRELRSVKDWTLADLAKQSGVALSSLSRIETGKMTGTLESHILVAKALGVRLPELYADLDPLSGKIEYYPHSENHSKLVVKGAHLTVLTSGALQKKMLPVLMTVPAGKSSQKEMSPVGIEKFIYLLKGQLEMTAGDQTIKLIPGDGVYLQASMPHVFKNSGSGNAVALAVTSPPSV